MTSAQTIPASEPDRNQTVGVVEDFLKPFVPPQLLPLKDLQTEIPLIAKDQKMLRLIDEAVQRIPTTHRLQLGDARKMSALKPESLHLVLTSPPYWTLKEYRASQGQIGHIEGNNKDIEFLLMERKPGGYRAPGLSTRILSVISAENHKKWFQQIWSGVTGASTRDHPAPYPPELAERLIRMFSFIGDTVLDPFLETATTAITAAKTWRNTIGLEIDERYFDSACTRIANETSSLFSKGTIDIQKDGPTWGA